MASCSPPPSPLTSDRRSTSKVTTAQPSRRSQVASACESCRISKVKCSGKHPTCARCRARGTECKYDVLEEGMTKREHLRHELTDQKQGLERTTAVLGALQHGSDQQAANLLARLRIGVTVDELYEQLLNEQQSRGSSEKPPSEVVDMTLTRSNASKEHAAATKDSGATTPTAKSLSRGKMIVDEKYMNHAESAMRDDKNSATGGPARATGMMGEPDWISSYAYSPTSTYSLADLNTDASQSNIDPALQTW